MTDHKYDTLVLSGGGVKGFFLLGAIQCLIDQGILSSIHTYVATSVGAIICYLLAIGYTPIEIVVALHTNKWLERMQFFNLVSMINCNGAIPFSTINESLEKLTIEKIGHYITLQKLKETYGKTLICTTYNMTTCTTEYLGPENYPDLPCLTALRMSCNLPLVFDRFKYMDNYYIDGGMSDNFPILKGEELSKNVLGIYLEIDEQGLQDKPEDGLVQYFIKLLQIPMVQGVKHKIALAKNSKIISIQTGGLRNLLDFDIKSKVRLEMFSEGYTQVKNCI